MMKIAALIVLLALGACSSNAKKVKVKTLEMQTPNIAFEITEGISHPESALYSAEHQAIFVSNVTSGNPMETKRIGNISKYSADGKVIAAPWIKGLKAPKGMSILGNFLYVSDVNQVVKIDIKKSKIVQTLNVSGAKFLNDVVADKNDNVYVSDTFTDTIHIWNKKGVKVWMRSPTLRGPNGLFTDGVEHLLLVSWGNPIDAKTFGTQELGALSALPLKKTDAPLTEEKSFQGNLDGITLDNAGNLWVSDWMNGDVYKVKKDGSSQKVYNLAQGTSDITFAKELNLLLVPQMNQSKVLAIKVN